MIRVAIVDDHPVVRAGLGALIGAEPDMVTAGTAGSCREALELLVELPADVCVVDLHLPDGDGIALACTVRKSRPEVRMLVLTLSSDPAAVIRSLGAGLDGYVLKDSAPAELVAAIRAVAQGSVVLGRGASTPVVKAAAAAPDPAPLARLDSREREILALLAQGQSVTQVANRLYLAPKTVRNRVTGLLHKLGLETREEAVALVKAEDP